MKWNFEFKRPIGGIIGHRGAAGIAPENTQASVERAIDLGVSWIEFDVRLSKDHKLVIIHDEAVERTSNGKGLVANLTLEQLKSLNMAAKFPKKFPSQTILTLEQTLKIMDKHNIFPNIDIKISKNALSEEIELMAKSLTNCIQKVWPKSKPLPLIASFNWKVLFACRKLIPNITIGLLTKELDDKIIEKASKVPNSTFHCSYKNLNISFIEKILANNLCLLVFTVDDVEIVNELLNSGCYGIFTNRPDLFSCV